MSTTPAAGKRSLSQSHRAQSPPQRPTTPLRPPSRSSLHGSNPPGQVGYTTASPINTLEPAFAELSDSMADLEANFMHLQLMHESLSRFSDCFASFLYGLNVNAWCVDFPEVRTCPRAEHTCCLLSDKCITQAPTAESFRRAQDNPALSQGFEHGSQMYPERTDVYEKAYDGDQTFL
jgi:DASH complex subunit DAM1